MTTMSRRQLHRRCAALLRELRMPVPFDARALCDQVAARRGRPIRLIPVGKLTGVCGLWIATDTMDLIFYEQRTTPPHQEHIILHELSHLLCHHNPESTSLAVQAQHLVPNLAPELVRRILGRAGYSTMEEREAETLASMIRQHAKSHGGGTLTDRLQTALDEGGHG